MRKLLRFLLAIAVICSFSTSAYADSSNCFSQRRVGDIVEFGSYEQDNNYSNGKESIRWIVVEKFNNCIKLVSEYVLDSRVYSTGIWDSAWENSDVRSWLNNEFYRDAFSEEEKTAILLTDVDNSTAQRYGKWRKPKEPDTQDYVYLLSYAEAHKYLGMEKDVYGRKSRIEPTDYAVKTGAHVEESIRTAEGTRTGWWMLRSPGGSKHGASCVNNGGGLSDCNVTLASGCICPVLWADLSSPALKREAPAAE